VTLDMVVTSGTYVFDVSGDRSNFALTITVAAG
jgi:hypothetical protein